MKYYHKDIVLDVPTDVYYPAEDSELMAEFLENNKKKMQFKKVLEIGCGSGFLSILCAKLGASVTSVDLNEVAVETTRKNAKQNNVHLNVIVSNMFSKITEKFDVIIFNPPYLPEDNLDIVTKKYNKKFSLQYSKKDVIKRFLVHYKKYLVKDGIVYILVSSVTNEKIPGKIVARKKIDWEELQVWELGYSEPTK